MEAAKSEPFCVNDCGRTRALSRSDHGRTRPATLRHSSSVSNILPEEASGVLETLEECRKVAVASAMIRPEKGLEFALPVVDAKRARSSPLHAARPREGSMARADHVVVNDCAGEKGRYRHANLRMAYAHLQVYLARRAAAGSANQPCTSPVAG